jgi:hypothetical protein
MKMFIALACLIASVSSFAADVKITSFNYIRTSGDTFTAPLAELCGTVTGLTDPAFVKVVVDHKSNKPANYNTVVDTDGKFCMAVITYRGTAEANVMGSKTVATIKE